MFKKIAVLLLFCMALGIPLLTRPAEAAAAPPLTKAAAVMIGSENTPLLFVPSAYPHMVDKVFSGENIFVRLKYSGYPNWNAVFVKVNGHSVKWQETSRIPINNPATGYFHNITVPFAEFDKNRANCLEVTVHGSRGNVFTAQVNGIRIK